MLRQGLLRPPAWRSKEVSVRVPIPKGSVVPPAVLAARARLMRFEPSPEEAALWRLLSGGKLGVAFRRQVPLLGRFVADFFAPEARLVVEVDGARHLRRRGADARRDEKLRRAGYQVLRLPAELVRREPAVALARIRVALAVQSPSSP
jgi:very-short-patch-repair endonuclease